jgi:ribosomal protein S4E
MPYQKTKEGRLVNEVTLGDGYPLSNDKQPLKVGGEASIINVSSPTPDGSVDGEVEVKGKLKAKDTVIQGDLKVFSDSDTYPQFVLQSKQGTQCQLRVQAAANSSSYVRIQNNQGYWKVTKPASNTQLTFSDGTNTPLILDGSNVDIDGTVTYKHTAFSTAGPTDNVDVSGTTVLEVDTSSNNVTIGGFIGGVQGQILYIVKTNTSNFIQLEHNEGGGSQDIFLTTGSDERVVGYGGYTLYCNGTSWFSLSNPTGNADAG